MTDAILGVVLEKSISLIQNEFAKLSGLRGKAEKLSNTLTMIRAVLEDAEERQMTDRRVKVWVQQLRDAAHVLDDILDDCSVESLLNGGLSSFNPKNILFRREVGRRLKEIMERLDQIAKLKNDYGLRVKEGVRERPTEVAEWRQTTPISPKVYGRDEDKKKVVDFLLSPARKSDSLSVYPIVGLGGLGKTTLAQFVYNDQTVSDHFKPKIWVCVSENFTRKHILGSIIESLKESCDVSNLVVMEQKVQELLQSKRYLLVLDDVWKKSQDMEHGLTQDIWDQLRCVLSCGSRGSSILVSTRDMDVAAIMGTCQAHQLSGLSDEDCWLLFKQRAFGSDREERAELIQIGKEIVKKCGGLPLAAQALGGVMRSRNGKREWLEVKESKIWTLPEENGILPALRLSYSHLMPTQKQCFAFCAIFPKDREIKKQELIYLWMANEFISSRENLEVEEVGNMVWNELYQKSFFEDIRINDRYDHFFHDFGNIYFKMHDLVHDLAQSIMKEECMCLEKLNLQDLPRRAHHIGFIRGGEKPMKRKACKNVESLRTLFQFNLGHSGISHCIPNSIRVLRASSFMMSSLENLTHLRYLELHDLQIKTLPDSIYKLRRLEILKLMQLTYLVSLPKHLTRLQNLRHLIIEDCDSLSLMCPNIHKLSHLRTLSEYIVNTETGHSLTELHDLKLGGELSIKGLQNVSSLSEAEGADLKGKEDLQVLSLSWGRAAWVTDAGQVLEALQPHPNLKVLTISHYRGSHLPNWMRNSSDLNKLVHLTLNDWEFCSEIGTLGKLPFLKSLEMERMKYVECLDGGECYDGVVVRAFPSLENLRLIKLPNLDRLMKMEKGDAFPRLSKLIVSSCPKLKLSFLPCLKDLRVSECNNELLKSISCLDNLDSLSLERNEDITSFQEGMMNNLTGLKRLEISNFTKLKELPHEMARLNALKSLTIWNCDELELFPEQVMEGLCSLQCLRIEDCRGLRSLPDSIQHLTSLEYLHIHQCGGLRSLPDSIQHLTSLETLNISNCPELEKRYEEGTGEDREKIKHIPTVNFDILF